MQGPDSKQRILRLKILQISLLDPDCIIVIFFAKFKIQDRL